MLRRESVYNFTFKTDACWANCGIQNELRPALVCHSSYVPEKVGMNKK